MEADCSDISFEVPVVGHGEERLDLVATLPQCAASGLQAATAWLDVTVVHPMGVQALTAGSATTDGAAARVAEQGKSRTYKDKIEEGALVPAVFEAGRRLGEMFLSLLRGLAPTDTSTRSKTLQRMT